MPEPVETIKALYAALNAHDGEAAAACYAPGAVFTDPAFGRLTAAEGGPQAMWRMLCGRSKDLAVVLHDPRADGAHGSARWVATYTFATGRKVVNDIQARFMFDADGLIAEHVDVFDLRKWAAQALGPVAGILGYTPLLKPLIHKRTSSQLAEFRSAG